MLTPFDDYPLHQTPDPIAHPATGDLNVFDRYFFNGFDPSGEVFFAVSLGLYPNRGIIDAAFSVLRDGAQRSVFASGRIPPDRTRTVVGPISVDVLEPLRTLRVSVRPGHGLAADITFRGRTPAVEEPRFRFQRRTHVIFDYTRMTQFGAWSGWITVGDDVRVELDPALHRGCRDRSWGVRPVGERTPGPSGPPMQFFWLWAPIGFDDACTLFDVNEDAFGHPWHSYGAVVPVADPGDGVPLAVEPMRNVEHVLRWEPGTRRSAGGRITLHPFRGEPEVIDFEPVLTFPLQGIGYMNREWGHGRWKGELSVGTDSWRVESLDPLGMAHVHVQQLVKATWGDRVGYGTLEQMVVGPHEPSGFAELLDGAH